MLTLVSRVPTAAPMRTVRHFSGTLLRADCANVLGIMQITATLRDDDGHQHQVHIVYGRSELGHQRAREHHADLRAGSRYHGSSTLQQRAAGITRHFGLTALRPARAMHCSAQPEATV